MLKQESVTINGTEYEITQLPYSVGRKLLLRLYKVMGPTLAATAAKAPDLGDVKSLGDISVERLLPALTGGAAALADNLSEKDFEYMVDTLAGYTKVSNGEGGFLPLKQEMEFLFAGNYMEQFQWLGMALKVNYLGFMKGRGLLGEALRRVRAAQTASRSPSTSTGTPTESQPASNTAVD